MNKEEALNYLIGELKHKNELDTNQIRDGYHSFGELYEHRIVLFIELAKLLWTQWRESDSEKEIWKSLKHSDGTTFEGWFVLGINKKAGSQITYHIPIEKWDSCWFADTLDLAPTFDGHTSEQVLERIKTKLLL